ncbi:methyl-accepting chemotaxis protein [Solidesulfovibrio sp.]
MKIKSLNTIIGLKAGSLIFALLCCCVLLFFYQKQVITEQVENETYGRLYESLNQRLEKKIDVGITNAIAIASYPGLADLIKQGRIAEAASTVAGFIDLYGNQSNYKGIRIQIFDDQFKTIHRNWKSGSNGESSEPIRKQLDTVKTTGKALATFVSDGDGVFLRGTATVSKDGGAVGYLQFLQGVGSVSRDYENEGMFYVLLLNKLAIDEAPQLGKNRKLGSFWLSNDSWFGDTTVKALSGLDLNLLNTQKFIHGNGLFAIGVPLKDVAGKITGLNVLAISENVLDNQISKALYGTVLLIGVVAIGVIIMIILLLWSFKNSALKPLDAISKYARAVADGHWDAEPRGQFRYQLSLLKDSLVSMVEQLHVLNKDALEKGKQALAKANEAQEALEAIKEREQREIALMSSLQQSARKAETISMEVAKALHDLNLEVEVVNNGVTVQKDRMNETSAAMEQMNATVIEVARNAADAASNALSSRDMALSGAQGVRRAVESIIQVEHRFASLKQSMTDLGQQAESIGRILGVISDIADQTNLLALNAAIEAARAGDAGRGFAVVADEVRKLAEKTMTATQEVAHSIQGIQQSARNNVEAVETATRVIEESTATASESGQTMEKIVSLVEGTSSQVDSIATAAEQQSATSEQVSRAIREVTDISSETSEAMNRSFHALSALQTHFVELKSIIQNMDNQGDTERLELPGETKTRK